MTAEHIHDALTLLPADLVAAADRRRHFPPKRIPWRRYTAIAACFALVCTMGWCCTLLFSPKESAMDAAAQAPMMQAASPELGMEGSARPEDASPAEAAPMEDAAAGQAQAENTMNTIDLPAVTLSVRYGQGELAVPAQGYHLFIRQDGTIQQDLPLDTNSAVPELETREDTLELCWSQEPDQLSVWHPDEATGTSALAVTGNTLTLLPGSHTYYFTGHWEDFTIRYAIHVTLLEP